MGLHIAAARPRPHRGRNGRPVAEPRLGKWVRVDAQPHLQPKLVEEEVDEVLDAAEQVPVQLLAGAIDADGLGGQWGQLVLPAVVFLAPVHNGLEHQQQQDLQVVLGGRGGQLGS